MIPQGLSAFTYYIPSISPIQAHNWAVMWEIDKETAYGQIRREWPFATTSEIDAFLQSVVDHRNDPRKPAKGEYVLISEDERLDYLHVQGVEGETVHCLNVEGRKVSMPMDELLGFIELFEARIVRELPRQKAFIFEGKHYRIDPEPESYSEWFRQSQAGMLGFGGQGFRITPKIGPSFVSFNVIEGGEVDEPNTVLNFQAISREGRDAEWDRRTRKGVAA